MGRRPTQALNSSDMLLMETFTNLVFFNGDASKDAVMAWCHQFAKGAVLVAGSEFVLSVRPEREEISGVKVPSSQVTLKPKFAILFENKDDITRLKLSDGWNKNVVRTVSGR